MSEFQLVMPKMGESIAEATIIRWLKNEGDRIEADEAVLEIATDKVDSEVPTPKGGVLGKKLYKDGDVVQVGAPVAIILSEGESTQTSSVSDSINNGVKEPETLVEPVRVPVMESSSSTITGANAPSNTGNRFYSPLVLNIARTEGVGMEELEKITGTGNEDRVTKRDILNYIENKANQPAPSSISSTPTEPSKPVAPAQVSIPEPSKPAPKPVSITMNAGDEIIEMDRMRKLIADHMVMSVHTSPHVTSFVEADVTNLVNWRNKMKDIFKKREGENLTFTPLFIEAVVKAIKDFPMINISLDGDKIIKRKNINIGMAAALPSGNLIVPVIKNADTKNLLGLAKEVNDLANRARMNKLTPDDIQGGTYTITNVGTFGNVLGTPIINQPQVAIMATGAIRKKPAVLETEFGDVIAIRQMMFLSHSYDHRVVDGALGGSFVRRVADYLENWDINREI